MTERRGKKVVVFAPQRGDKLRLVEMARENARRGSSAGAEAASEGTRQVAELGRKLRLRTPPRHLECVDIATFQGGESVGAVVCFIDGQPWKDGYRRYRVRSVVGTDDFASVAEVLGRRFRPGERREPLPDLLVIDGGAGQLAAARAVLAEVGLPDLPVIGLAKERVEREPTAREIARRPERSPRVGRTRSSYGPTRWRSFLPPARATKPIASRTPTTSPARPCATCSPLDDVPGRPDHDAGATCCATSGASAACVPRPSRS